MRVGQSTARQQQVLQKTRCSTSRILNQVLIDGTCAQEGLVNLIADVLEYEVKCNDAALERAVQSQPRGFHTCILHNTLSEQVHLNGWTQFKKQIQGGLPLRVTVFHGHKPPNISVRAFLDRIRIFGGCSACCFVLGIRYVERLQVLYVRMHAHACICINISYVYARICNIYLYNIHKSFLFHVFLWCCVFVMWSACWHCARVCRFICIYSCNLRK